MHTNELNTLKATASALRMALTYIPARQAAARAKAQKALDAAEALVIMHEQPR